MFSKINDLVFVKKRQGQSWLDVSFWYAGIVLILLLQTAPLEIQGACSCDSSVPPCQNTVSSSSNGTTALSSCHKAARDDCPCCFVCAGQLGDACSLSQPCDPSHSLVCKANECQKEVMPCNYENKRYLPDETFYTQSCQTKCSCSAEGGQTFCQPTTCRPGLLIKGFLAEDPLCEERQVDADDDCCVLVVCSSVAEESEAKAESLKKESLASSKKSETTTEATEGRAHNNNSNNGSFANLEFLQITPTTIQVQFPGITGGNLMYVEDRLFKGDGHDPFGHSSTPWENAIILEGNEIFTLTGLKAKTTYRLRWQAPNKQYPDLVVETHDYGEKPPKVIITGRTYDSVTLSFDHFAPEDYNHGYVAMYKEVNGGRWQNYDEADISDEESFMSDLPSITITKLKPDTDYMARIAIYKDYSTRTLGKSTAVIEFKTSKGCFHQNESYPIGSFYVGCESSCECGDNGSVECSDRCIAPLQPAGRSSEDPLCVEQFLDDDKCCVLLTCAGNADEDDPEGPCKGIECGPNAECRHEVFRGEGAGSETICVCKEGYSGDPDSQRGCNEHTTSPDRATVKPKSGCVVKNETYGVGEDWYDGCDYKCSCSPKLEILCQPRCKSFPDVTGQKCELRTDTEDSCCKVMFCPDPKAMDDLKPVSLPFDGCQYKNLTYKQGERFYDGCEQQCQCMGYGDMVCLSRCPPTAPAPGQNCYTLPDASDPCCNITVCDKPVPDPDQNVPKEEISKEAKQPRVINEQELTEAFPDEVTTTAATTTIEPIKTNEDLIFLDSCNHKGQIHQIGAEFYDSCEQYCSCQGPDDEAGGQPEVLCHPIKCPSAFGLDIINPFCLEWDSHESFEPKAPECCPPVPVCMHDGTCQYEGAKFNNFDNIPANLTGCEKRCYCENGEVLCQDACYDIPDEPPGYLSCASNIAIKVAKDDRPCCQTWGCPKIEDLPSRLQSVQFDPVNETSLQVNLRVPRILEGRSGFYKVYYTSGLSGHPDPEKWPSTSVTPKNGLFAVDANDESSFVLSQLLPNQQYFLRVALHVRDADAEKVIFSEILSAKTPEVSVPVIEPTPSLEIRRIEVNLTVENVESNSAYLSWRFFSLEEKQFLDGVQIRFTELRDGSPASGVPGTTPFIHRDTNFFLLEDLKPDTEYQVDLYLIPVPNASTELISNSTESFRTKAPVQDPFEFDIQLNVEDVTKQIVSLSWTGVPTPHQKYVNIYRILYLEDHSNSLEGRSVFKVAKIDSSRSARITHLRPATKYQMWLEAYLRNGKVIQSNVLEVLTDDGQYDPLADYDESQEPFVGTENPSDSHYYNSMIAAIVVAVVVSAVLIVLGGFYLKRNITYKAIISGGANRSDLAHSNKGLDGVSSLSSRGSSGIAKSDSFEMTGRNHHGSNGNGNSKSALENP